MASRWPPAERLTYHARFAGVCSGQAAAVWRVHPAALICPSLIPPVPRLRAAPNPQTQEFAAGKQLLSGEYILPSGTALPFGAMISKLKRAQIMGDVVAGGEARQK